MCAMALYSDDQYKAAKELETEVMEARKRVLGDEHPDTLLSMNNSADSAEKLLGPGKLSGRILSTLI
jgi:hypothetical protein